MNYMTMTVQANHIGSLPIGHTLATLSRQNLPYCQSAFQLPWTSSTPLLQERALPLRDGRQQHLKYVQARPGVVPRPLEDKSWPTVLRCLRLQLRQAAALVRQGVGPSWHNDPPRHLAKRRQQEPGLRQHRETYEDPKTLPRARRL